MRTRAPLTACFTAALALQSLAALPPVPAEPLAAKGDLLFEDNFEGATADRKWHQVVPTFTRENGVLKGTQTRTETIPPVNGKGGVMAHAAVHGLELPTRDSIVEVRVKLDGASMVDVEFDDRKYTGAHYGHLCRAQVRLNGITIMDERDGGMRNDIREMRNDPGKKAEVARLLQGRSAMYPMKLEAGKWYTLGVETVGDAMRVTLDGQPAAYLKSSGIAHETKSKLEFGVAGKDGCFDDLRVYAAKAK